MIYLYKFGILCKKMLFGTENVFEIISLIIVIYVILRYKIYNICLKTLSVYSIIGFVAIVNYILFRFINLGKFLGFYNVRQSEDYCSKVFFPILHYSMKLLFWIKIEYVNKSDSQIISGQNIIICNHVSYFDPFVIGYIHYKHVKEYWKIKYIAYHKIFQVPLVGYIVKSVGAIPIEMKDTKVGDKNVYVQESVNKMKQQCDNALNEGYSLFIFPEGQRNTDPMKLNEIKSGPLNFSIKSGCPIQVLSLKGIEKIWPAMGKPNGQGTITVTKCDNPKMFTYEEYIKKVPELMKLGI